MKKTASLILAVVMLLSVTACGEGTAKKDFEYITTGYGENADGDYKKAVSGWEKNNSDAILEEFDNLADDGVAATTGNMESLENVDMARPMSKKTDSTVFKAAGDTMRVVDTMGNAAEYRADKDGNVTVPLTGSPVYIFGVK